MWIATLRLHHNHPEATDFSIEEIVDRVEKDDLDGTLRPGVYVHVVQHCVANRPPNPGRYRMLFETADGRRRLFREGDVYHPEREGAKITPAREDLPYGYNGLLTMIATGARQPLQALQRTIPFSLRGSGRQLWSSKHADEYVRRLRESWE